MNSKLLMSTLVCTLGLLAGSVNAKPQEGQPNRDMHRLFAGLELTESQKDQLKALHQAHQTENQALRDANQADKAAHQAKIKALLADPSFDDQQAQALISEGSAKHQAMALKQLQRKHAMLQLLTPEQQEKFLANETKMHKKGFKNKARKGPYCPNGKNQPQED